LSKSNTFGDGVIEADADLVLDSCEAPVPIVRPPFRPKLPPPDHDMRIYSILLCLLDHGDHDVVVASQTSSKPTKALASADDLRAVRSSPAYAEVLLRETELKAELESLLLDYTEEYRV
jgi:hypothetical protein